MEAGIVEEKEEQQLRNLQKLEICSKLYVGTPVLQGISHVSIKHAIAQGRLGPCMWFVKRPHFISIVIEPLCPTLEFLA